MNVCGEVVFLRLGCSSKIASTRGQEILREKILRGQEKVNQVYFEPGKVESLKKRQRKLEF